MLTLSAGHVRVRARPGLPSGTRSTRLDSVSRAGDQSASTQRERSYFQRLKDFVAVNIWKVCW